MSSYAVIGLDMKNSLSMPSVLWAPGSTMSTLIENGASSTESVSPIANGFNDRDILVASRKNMTYCEQLPLMQSSGL